MLAAAATGARCLSAALGHNKVRRSYLQSQVAPGAVLKLLTMEDISKVKQMQVPPALQRCLTASRLMLTARQTPLNHPGADFQDFIDQADDMMLDYVEAQLKTLDIPQIMGVQSWGTYEINGVKTRKFTISPDKIEVDTAGRYKVLKDSVIRQDFSKTSAKVRSCMVVMPSTSSLLGLRSELPAPCDRSARWPQGWWSKCWSSGPTTRARSGCALIEAGCQWWPPPAPSCWNGRSASWFRSRTSRLFSRTSALRCVRHPELDLKIPA